MSSGATLNSRLRVLVARAFRAEKLYGSTSPARAERRLSFPQLAEAAGELRAKEWQKGYYHLRSQLNDLLSLGSSQSAVDGVLALRKHFRERMEEATQFVEQATHGLQEAAARHEFSHLLKLTLELIRQKAIAQSSRAICDELGAVLKASGLNDFDREPRLRPEPSWLTQQPGGSRDAMAHDSEGEYTKNANVVPLRRHQSVGKVKR